MPPVDLAHRVADEGLHEDEPLRHLVASQLADAVPRQILDRHLGICGHLHRGGYALSKALVRRSEYGAGLHSRRGLQHAFDLGGIHIGSPANDHLVAPVPHIEVPLGVDIPEVAGVHHSAAQQVLAGIASLPVAEWGPVDTGPRTVLLGAYANLASLGGRNLVSMVVANDHPHVR